jgi:Na+/H+ antiporter NhaD/arsenite permease-like protein
MDATILTIFGLVYLGMILGEFPGLALDRTGFALLGAIALIAFGKVTAQQAWDAVDVPTIGLLFGLMVISSQFRLSGFYAHLTRKIAAAPLSPDALLALLVGVVGLLSGLLGNDIICLAMAPVLIEGCARRSLDPVPFLIALACASNVGSAATLIGNPQNVLIGEALDLSFAGYLLDGGVPALLGLAATWWIICRSVAGRWHTDTPVPPLESSRLDRWQTLKGLVLLIGLTAAFIAAPWPRDVLTLVVAGVLLLSRKMESREMLGQVDWHLIVLFIGLFVVNYALQASGALPRLTDHMHAAGVDLRQPGWLFIVTVVLSNLVSNVPATMLLLPSAEHGLAGPILALASTLAGNLFIVGSIANIIVVEQAGRLGVNIPWRRHARIGVPVTIATLAIAAGWLVLRAR